MSHEFWRTFALYVITKEETKTFRVGALNLLVGPTLHAAAKTWYSCFRASWYNLVYKAESLFVCLFAPYTNSHFWTDLNQTLHISPPWSGRDRRVCMNPNFLPFRHFDILFASVCRFQDIRWLPEQESSAIALYPWFLQMLVRRHGNDVVADDSCAFLLQMCWTFGNA